MFRQFPEHDPKITELSHAILTMLNSPGTSAVTIDMQGTCPKRDDGGADVQVDPSSGGRSDIDVGDWDELFRAVTTRLRVTVGEPLAATSDAWVLDMEGRIQVIVLECVAALEQLHTALTDERDRREQFEREVLNAQAALARALANSSARWPQVGVLAPVSVQSLK
jgi:hypothetical protein